MFIEVSSTGKVIVFKHLHLSLDFSLKVSKESVNSCRLRILKFEIENIYTLLIQK